MNPEQLKQYRDIKRRYKECILLMRFEEKYLVVGQDAQETGGALNIPLSVDEETETFYTWLTLEQLDYILHRLCKDGYKVAVCDPVLKTLRK